MRIPTDNSTNDEPECFSRFQIIKTKTIPTSKPKKELDIKAITSLDDLKSLKAKDPFMYYSIPGVRSTEILMKDDLDIDTSNLGVSKITRSFVFCPYQGCQLHPRVRHLRAVALEHHRMVVIMMIGRMVHARLLVVRHMRHWPRKLHEVLVSHMSVGYRYYLMISSKILMIALIWVMRIPLILSLSLQVSRQV